MKKISNREEANNYYKLVNSAVSDFMSQTKARPSEVHKYLSKNRINFLKRIELSDVAGIENVLDDVLLHHKHLEDDKIITFENFSKFNEGFVFVGSPSLEHEKMLADLHNTSLGHIDLVDAQLHLYRINDFGEEIYSVIFSELEINKIKEELKSKIVSEMSEKTITIDEVSGIQTDYLNFYVGDFIDERKLNDVIYACLSNKFVFNYIISSLSSDLRNLDMYSGSMKSFKSINGFYIWSTK